MSALTALIFPNQSMLASIDWLSGAIMPLVQLVFLHRMLGRRPARYLFVPAIGVAVYGFVLLLWRMSGQSSFSEATPIFLILTASAALSLLGYIGSAWRDASAVFRALSVGVVLSQTWRIYDILANWVGWAAPPSVTEYVAFLSFLVFVVLALVFTTLETGARELREQVQNSCAQAIAQTATMFAHDVRTPFTLMRMSLRELRTARTMAEVAQITAEAFAEIEATTGSVESMISDILGSPGKDNYELAPAELRDVLATSLTKIAQTYQNPGICLIYDLQHTRQVAVVRDKIERAIGNIIYHGLEEMQGSGRLWLTSRDIREGSKDWAVCVIGTQGLKASTQRSFFRDKQAGLGLAIVKKIVEGPGGRVSWRSVPSQGVECEFTLPTVDLPADSALVLPGTFSAIDRPQEASAANGMSAAVTDESGYHTDAGIVLVEDSRTMRRAWERRYPPGSLIAFATPSECLAAVAANPAIIADAFCFVLDQRFPPGEMEGADLARKLRVHTKAPILLCSGLTMDPLDESFDAQIAKDAYGLDDIRGIVEARANSHGRSEIQIEPSGRRGS